MSTTLTFLAPWWLLLLAGIPVLWWWSLRSLSGLGKTRRWIALLLRTFVLIAVILALAEAQLKRTSDKLTVIYLIDQSISIPEEQRRLMIRYVNEEIRKHRNATREDKAGVIVFAREPAVEHPPYDEAIRVPENIESRIETDATNLAGAMKLAQAALPEDSAGRIVIICDGNENIGDARAAGRRLAETGVGIDVVPIGYLPRGEVAVEKISIPNDVNRGQPFELRVVVDNLTPPPAKGQPATKPLTGKLVIKRKAEGNEVVLEEKPITLPPGKSVYSLREEIDAAGFYTYDATFVPDDKRQDGLSQNNTATAFSQVRGKGQVLLIEYEEPENNVPRGQYDFLVERLRKENLQVTVRSTRDPVSSLGELQPYDSVILANCPREQFTDEQIRMLVYNTRELGAGLILLGGEHSFGAGGWAGTELEAALPVDFQIRNAQVAPVGALAMIMHASEMANGNYWQTQIGIAAVDALGSQDYCGVLQWNGTANWLWKGVAGGLASVGKNRTNMKANLDTMTPGDMPDFESTMLAAAQAFALVDANNPNRPANMPAAAVKHLIIISDGDPSQPTQATMNQLSKLRVTITTVGVGTHGAPEDGAMQAIANYDKSLRGKYHKVTNPKNLPKIYQQEARKISRPLIYENATGIGVLRKYPHEMLKGIEGNLPPLTGYVRSTVKVNPLVEVALVAAEPKDAGAESEKYNTLLASWTYGLGKSVVWTSDTGQRWANNWSQWGDYDRFFSQMVRWSMRPSGDMGKFNITTETKDGKGRIIITALDQDDAFMNFMQFNGNVVGPNFKSSEVAVKQVAPGRYVAEFNASESGNYFLTLAPIGADGKRLAPILTGVNVPYSPEFLDREPNEALLRDLASLQPAGSEPGTVIQGQDLNTLLNTDTFRHNLTKATSQREIWHWILFGGGILFFFDVFFRRVAIDWAFIGKSLAAFRDKLLRRQPIAETAVTLDRLRSSKAALQAKQREARAATSLDAPPSSAPLPSADPSVLDRPTGAAAPKPGAASPPPEAPPAEAEDHMSRLLKAKKRVWEDKDKDGGSNKS
jgi:uncharacterized membrane protein